MICDLPPFFCARWFGNNVEWDDKELATEEDKIWNDDWDDEEASDSAFQQRLREELARAKAAAAAGK